MIKSIIKHTIKVLNRQEIIRFQPLLPKNWLSKNGDRVLCAKNDSVYKTIVSCSGCGFSGSSAVTDYLAEFDVCSAFGGVTDDESRGRNEAYEIDFFRDENGIYDLEKVICSPTYRSNNSAIHNFIVNVIKNYESKCPFYDDIYLEESKKFINDLIDFEIPLFGGDKDYVTKRLTGKQFRLRAASYIDTILRNIKSKDNLILDQFLTLDYLDFTELDEYFKSYKIIFVWSDPRDMYVRAMNHNVSCMPQDPESFVKYFKRRTNGYLSCNHANLLTISFDRLCYNYDSETSKVKSFLGLSDRNHKKKYLYFNPIESKKNTRLWQTYKDSSAIQYIYDNLNEYCISDK